MNINKFKEDFSQLLLQYVTYNPPRNNSTPEVHTALVHQEIFDAIQESLQSTFNVNLSKISASNLNTPANEIVVTTPNAPDISKGKYDANDVLSISRDQSVKSNISLRIDSSDISMTEIDTTPIADTSKLASDISQQDTSLLGKLETSLTEEQRIFRETLQSELSKLAEVQRNAMYKTLEDARRDALSVVDKIEDIRDLLAPELKPNRRLSSMLELLPPKALKSADGPSGNLRVSQRRSIQAARRSISSQQKRGDTSVTPTSRLSSIRAPPCSPSDNASPAVTKVLRSAVSMSSLPTSSKSPSKPKNSKYAHVQSTIPKPTPAVKRKAA